MPIGPKHSVTDGVQSRDQRHPEARQTDRRHESARASAGHRLPADRPRCEHIEHTYKDSGRRLPASKDAEARPPRKAGTRTAAGAAPVHSRECASQVGEIPAVVARSKGTSGSSFTSLGPLNFELAVWRRSLKRLEARRSSRQADKSDSAGNSSPDSQKNPKEFASALASKLEVVQKMDKTAMHPAWCLLCIAVTWFFIWASKQAVPYFLSAEE